MKKFLNSLEGNDQTPIEVRLYHCEYRLEPQPLY